MKLTRVFVAVIAVSALALGACGDDDDDGGGDTTSDSETSETQADEESGEPLSVPLAAQADSGITGTVTLTPDGDRTTVLIELQGEASTEEHPAHVHDGSCTEFVPEPAYALENVVDGTSETTVDASIDELLDEPYVVNVHRSEAKIQEYVACGPIVSTDSERVVDLAAQGDAGLAGTVTMTPQEDGTTLVVVELEGDESTEPHPSHIHAGTCDTFTPAPLFPLENIVEGRSETTLDASLAELTAAPAILNVHESEPEIQNYISCGAVA